jgi:rhombotail lipoprotein
MKTWKSLLLLAPVALAGCASGFDRVALQERLDNCSLQMPDADIAAVRGTLPQLKLPCRVAVYFKPSNDTDWRWTPEDRAALEPCAAALKAEGIASEVITLPEMLVGKDPDFKGLRLAAAKCGADVLLVVNGAAQTDSYKNPAAVFNLTIVGGYVVPASHKDTLFMMEACLFDVDNSYVYTGLQAEGVGKIVRPTFVVEEKDSVAIAKSKAVAQFGEELLKRMRNLSGGTTNGEPIVRLGK